MSYTLSLNFGITNILIQITGAHSVTLKMPLKGELFADFHKQPSGGKDIEIPNAMSIMPMTPIVPEK
jgi:hypothetical protein